MVRVRLGNAAPVDHPTDPKTGEKVRTPIEVDGPEVATMELHEDNLKATLATAEALWNSISDAPPVWVAADDEAVELLLASHFACERGEPAPKAKKGAKS